MKLHLLLAKNLKQMRRGANLSQEKFAELIGLHRNYYSGIERGTRNITINILERIIKNLDVNAKVLFKDK